jgi:hypothetical protein
LGLAEGEMKTAVYIGSGNEGGDRLDLLPFLYVGQSAICRIRLIEHGLQRFLGPKSDRQYPRRFEIMKAIVGQEAFRTAAGIEEWRGDTGFYDKGHFSCQTTSACPLESIDAIIIFKVCAEK